MPSRFTTGVGELGPGDHACLVCDSDQERWITVADFLRHGIECRERTVLITAAEPADQILRRLGPSASELSVLSAPIAHGYGDGEFDYVERLAGWCDEAHAAVADGFSGMRVAVDMTWLYDVALDDRELVDYERFGTELFDGLPATALCVYDSRHFDDHRLARACHAHRLCLGSQAAPSPVFASDLLEIATAGPGALRLSGEIDPSNVAALAHALEAAFTDRGLLVDMSEVEFIDVAGLRKMHQVSSRVGGELVLLSPKPVVRKSIELLGIGAPVTIDEAV